MKKSILLTIVFILLLVAGKHANADILVDDTTFGYYNQALGTILDGTTPQIPLPHPAGGDPSIYPADGPNLTAGASILGDWLSSDPLPLNGNWDFQSIPSSWAGNTETAIIYSIDAGPGIENLTGNFGVDNGIFVWVNGQYKFGAREGGTMYGLEYLDIDLGSFDSGMNFIQILRSDNGGAAAFTVEIIGAVIPEPATMGLLAISGLALIRRRRK